MNEPDQSSSLMFRPTSQTTAQSFLPVSVYLDRSHSSFSVSFIIFFFFGLVLFYFTFTLPPKCEQVPQNEKKVLRTSQLPKWPPSTKKANCSFDTSLGSVQDSNRAQLFWMSLDGARNLALTWREWSRRIEYSYRLTSRVNPNLGAITRSGCTIKSNGNMLGRH